MKWIVLLKGNTGKRYTAVLFWWYVNKILVEEKCYSCEEKNHEQNNAYQ